MKNPIDIDKDGQVKAPPEPGLGTLIDEKIVEKYTSSGLEIHL